MAARPLLTDAAKPTTFAVEAYNERGEMVPTSVAGEHPLTLYLDKKELVTLMTLGHAPEALAIGYLRNQRLVGSIEDVASVQDLAGKTVNVDVRGSGTAMTASLVLEALGVPVQIANDPQDLALTKLRNGEIGAMVYVAGKPARLFSGIAAGSGLRFVPIPATPALLETYLPSSLSSTEYPNLVAAGTEVETIAVGAVMAVYAWQPGTERFRKVSRFTHAFTRRFNEFLQPPRHPKWKEVNLAAQVPGWTRFDPGPAPAQ